MSENGGARATKSEIERELKKAEGRLKETGRTLEGPWKETLELSAKADIGQK